MTQISPEARERLAKAYGAEGTAIELQEMLNPVPTKCALSAIQEVLDERDGLIDRLADAESVPWPQWADDIRKKLIEYGYDGGPENEWNIGECMESWIDGCLENETTKIDALTVERDTLRLRVQELEGALSFYAKEENWFSPSSGFVLQYDPEPSAIQKDWGAIARAAEAVGGGE